MANNLVVQLLLKTGTFSTDLKQAKGQIQQFQQGCTTAGRSLDAFGKSIGIDIGALTKFGSVIGVAAAAGAGLKKVIDSNQVSSDKFQAAIYASKTAVDSLATAIGTFDFSNFQDGLSGLISRAKEAAGAIDQLGNTLMSYNVLQAKANASMAKARAAQKNPNLSKEEKQALMDIARADKEAAKEATEMALQDYEKAIIAEANAKGAKLSGEGAMALVDEMLTLDGKRIRDDVKNSMKVVQDAYNKELSALQSNYQTSVAFGGSITGAVQYGTGVDTKNPEYQKQLNELNQRYQRLHVYNTLLIRESDESLEKMGQQRVAMYNLEASMANLEGGLDTIEKKINAGASAVTKSLSEEIQAQEGSLNYWQKIAQETQKHRDMEVFNSVAWQTYDKALQDALKHIEELETQLRKYRFSQEMKTNPLEMPANAPTGKAEVMKNKPGLVGVPAIPEPPEDTSEKWESLTSTIYDTANAVEAMSNMFQKGSKITTASILKMVSTTLPVLSSLIGTIATLAGVEGTLKAVETSKHWIEAIAAVAALGAAVAGAVAMAKSNGKYANGGIVPGSSFTGDRVTAQVNSGEMILNKTQQARLFKLANGGTVGGNQVEFHISGTELVGVIDNVNRKNRVIR